MLIAGSGGPAGLGVRSCSCEQQLLERPWGQAIVLEPQHGATKLLQTFCGCSRSSHCRGRRPPADCATLLAAHPHPPCEQIFRQLARLPPVTTEEEQALYARGVLPFRMFEYMGKTHPGLRVSAGLPAAWPEMTVAHLLLLLLLW